MKSHINTEQNRNLRIPGWIYTISIAGIAVGILAAIISFQRSPAVAWRLLLVNFLFWISLVQGAFMWSVAFRITRTTWSAAVNRLGHAFIWALPGLLIVFGLLFFGADHLSNRNTSADMGDRAPWLAISATDLRDGISLLLLVGLSFYFVYTYLLTETTLRSGELTDAKSAHVNRRLSVSGVILAVLYLLVFSLLAFDLIMPLMPRWHNALFGWYFVLGSLYSGMAALIVAASSTRKWLGVEAVLGPKRFLDLGNFLMAFAMAMTYFFFTQAMVIWYENLPPETSYLIARYHSAPWRGLLFALLAMCYAGPFALLVIREMKESIRIVSAVAALVVVAMWLERYFLVAPSLSPAPAVFPWLEVFAGLGIGLGFLGMVVLAVSLFLSKYPAQSPLDLVLVEEREAWA